MLGGNSDAALRRVAAWGDGWYGFNLDNVDAVRARMTRLEELCAEAGRDRAELTVAVAMRAPDPADVARLAAVGVDELVLVESPPDDSGEAAKWVAGLAERWMPALSSR
jgi:alkanesulfonate monooxygenase SsuD/methylene tetrahydromethanopterin reductase-like flavin-dependent oxidoreductase (luciferase family)